MSDVKKNCFASTLRFLHYYAMILLRISILLGDDGFEHGTFAPELFAYPPRGGNSS